MREIKFRAWDGKKMHYTECKNVEFTLARFGWSFDNIRKDPSQELCNDENGTLMRWSGLKDKDGEGIYEGDILTYEHNGDIEKAVMSFSDGHFQIEYAYSDCFADIISWSEIIGNIHENPELINE